MTSLARPTRSSVPELQRGSVLRNSRLSRRWNLWNADPGQLGWVSCMKRVLPGRVAASALLIVAGSIWPVHAQDHARTGRCPKPRASVTRAPGTTAEPTAATYNWTGAYVGFNTGAALGRYHTSKTTTPSPTYLFSPADVAAVNAAGQQQIKRPGFTGGVQAGYNWQFGRALLGIEADFNYLHMGGATTSGAVRYPASTGMSSAARRRGRSISSSSIPMPMPTRCWRFVSASGLTTDDFLFAAAGRWALVAPERPVAVC